MTGIDDPRLRIVQASADPRGHHGVPRGCCSCTEIVETGSPMVQYDDGEYYPTFCESCVKLMASLIEEAPA